MALEPPPFTVSRNQTVVTGGWLNQPWVVTERVIDGIGFIQLIQEDRRLARALGKTMRERHPWKDSHFLQYLTHLRDTHVDSLLHEARVAADPLGDPNVLADEQSLARGRCKLFGLANVPTIIEITYPAFVTEDGTRVPDTKLK